MFAARCIIFYGRTKQIEEMPNTLDHYCKVSGQLVNYNKCKIQFSTGINNVEKREITEILQINSSNTIKTYVGCSNIDKRITKLDFQDIKQRLGQRLAGSKARTLLVAGKIVVIKASLTIIS